ncbi:hypothetical protein ACIF8T_07260 [Streptomyces sp. NPDC085946]|uniref:hypothetical protein n=1 Tax=Streptomyces sp. NPDC085946 TaxID=3365744 RepID=UPI0037D03740
MTRPPAAARVLLASALSAAALWSAACSAEGRPAPRPASESAPSTSAAAPPAPSPAALTAAQAEAALVTPADLGEPWVPTRGAATWRDEMLKGSTDDPDCRRLLDVLYTEELLGAPAGARAVAALDDDGSGAQLHYQVAAHRPADVDRAVAWLASLPGRCGEFTATTVRGTEAHAEVTEVALPEAGDARAGVRVVVAAQTADGEQAYVTVEAAVVRVGDDAITLTHGGYGDLDTEVTRAAVELGARRLTDIRQRGRALV